MSGNAATCPYCGEPKEAHVFASRTSCVLASEVPDPPAATLDELTAEELVALGHSLRMVPSNTVIGPGFEFLTQSEAWKSLWEKVAHAVNTRDDVAPYRKAPDAAE